jgi:hypothetical protein
VERPEHAGGEAVRVAGRHRRDRVDVDPLGRHGLQGVGHAVVLEDRGAGGAHRLADLAQDRGGGLLQGDGAAEDLADGVEEVDLLVALGEFPGGLVHLGGGPEVRLDHVADHRRVRLEGRAGRRRAEHEDARAGLGAEPRGQQPPVRGG